MRRKYILFGRPSKPAGPDQIHLSSRHGESLNTALASLRRRADFRRNPLKPDEVFERVRYAAEVYRRWQESGTFIRNVVLRLSDGNEIKIDKATLKDTNLFGFQFMKKFPRGSVINLYKPADKEFPEEVLLYSIDLESVTEGGHLYDKTYENGQKLTLKVARGLSGQFGVSVKYTVPSGAVNITPLRRSRVVQLRPRPVELAGLCLLAVLVLLAVQKRGAVHEGPAGGGASGTTARVALSLTHPPQPPQTTEEGRLRRNDAADFNVVEASGSPGAPFVHRQLQSPARDADGEVRLPDGADIRQRKAPGVAERSVASRRSDRHVEQLPGESARPPEAARGNPEASGSGEEEDVKVTLVEISSRPEEIGSRPTENSKRVVWGVVNRPVGTPAANNLRGMPAGSGRKAPSKRP